MNYKQLQDEIKDDMDDTFKDFLVKIYKQPINNGKNTLYLFADINRINEFFWITDNGEYSVSILKAFKTSAQEKIMKFLLAGKKEWFKGLEGERIYQVIIPSGINTKGDALLSQFSNNGDEEYGLHPYIADEHHINSINQYLFKEEVDYIKSKLPDNMAKAIDMCTKEI